MKEMYSLM